MSHAAQLYNFICSWTAKMFKCVLTSWTGFQTQRVSNEGISTLHPWDFLQREPFVQVTAEQLVGDVREHGDEDADADQSDRGRTDQNRHLLSDTPYTLHKWLMHVCVCVCVNGESLHFTKYQNWQGSSLLPLLLSGPLNSEGRMRKPPATLTVNSVKR